MILVLHPSDELYGADRVVLRVVDEFAMRGEVQLWLPDDVEYPARALSRLASSRGIRVRRVTLPVLRRANMNARGVGRLLMQQLSLVVAMREARPVEVYINTSALAPALLPARLLRIPTTIHIHETFGTTERRIIGPMLRLAGTIVVVSEATRAALPRHARDRAIVQRHTIPPIPPPPEGETAALRQSTGIPPSAPVILLASRWTPGKGGDVALAALEAAGNPDLRLVVLGGRPPSGSGLDLEAAASVSPVTGQIIIVGEVPEVTPWLGVADAVALPSTAPDSYPTLALEAVAAGVPILASRIGGLPEIVSTDRGTLLPPGDVAAWATAFAKVTRRTPMGE